MMVMWLGTAIALTSALALRHGAHALILRGLRAPRLAHQRTPADVGLAAQAVRLPAAQGKTLFAWFVPVSSPTPSPAVVVMHGWGANASLMLPALAPHVPALMNFLQQAMHTTPHNPPTLQIDSQQ